MATLKKTKKLVSKTNYLLMQVKGIAECSEGSILQYFWPSLSYHLSLRSLFCLFWVAVLHMFYCMSYHETIANTYYFCGNKSMEEL